jgi:AcrR family transcriptional regulator
MTDSKNALRSERTRTALLDTARNRFARDGFAATSTPTIVEEAGVSRGALYHHFRDKADLFQAVVEREYATVAASIEAAAAQAMTGTTDSVAILAAGGDAFLDAMRNPGRRRILLIDGPAVLGPETMREINARHTGRTLRGGIAAAVACGDFTDLPVDALADLLDAAYDRIALVEDDDRPYRWMLRTLMDGLRNPSPTAHHPHEQAPG